MEAFYYYIYIKKPLQAINKAYFFSNAIYTLFKKMYNSEYDILIF